MAVAVTMYLTVGRGRLRTWGASPEEAGAVLAGDDVVGDRYRATHAISVSERPGVVWPWLVQMGFGRGGWYSYDWIERLIGAGSFADGGSTKRVIPELQSVAVGDVIDLSAAGGLSVVLCDPPHSLVLHMRMDLLTSAPASDRSRAVLNWTWAFVLQPAGEGTRLLVRVRAMTTPSWLALPLRPILELMHLVMERRMLKTIKQRAEATGRAPAA